MEKSQLPSDRAGSSDPRRLPNEDSWLPGDEAVRSQPGDAASDVQGTMSDRIRAATLQGGLPKLPPHFDDPNGDWQCIRTEDPFTQLYLDGQLWQRITTDVVERHAALLTEFWDQKIAHLSQGAAKVQIVAKFGDGNEAQVRDYPARIRRAHDGLRTAASIASEGERLRLRRIKAAEGRLEEGLRLAMADGQFVPAEAALLGSRATEIGLAPGEVRELLVVRLQMEGFRPIVLGRLSDAIPVEPFSVTWARHAPVASPPVESAEPGLPPPVAVPTPSPALPPAHNRRRSAAAVAATAIALAVTVMGARLFISGGSSVPPSGNSARPEDTSAPSPTSPGATGTTPRADPGPDPGSSSPPSPSSPSPSSLTPTPTPTSPPEARPAPPTPADITTPPGRGPVDQAPAEEPSPIGSPVPVTGAPETSLSAPSNLAPPAADETPLASQAPVAEPTVGAPASPSGAAPGRAAEPITQAPYQGPRSGALTYTGPPVVQNGEIVFRNLPPFRLRLDYDQDVWEGRLSPGEGNTQRLILRNKKPGTQKKCVVSWSVIP
jgi:hypothetical protein